MRENTVVAGAIAACFYVMACGGGSSSWTGALPTIPSRTVVAQDIVTLPIGAGSASFMIDRGGGPGKISYNVGCGISLEPAFYGTPITIQRVQQWTLGPDAEVYRSRDDSMREQIGGVTRIVGISCPTGSFDDLNIARPTAITYRATVEFTVDNGSLAGVQVVTTERAIVSNVPQRPLMTNLSLTSNAVGQPPRFSGAARTFVATGSGGTPPYQFQWRSGNNIVVRDWGPESTFVWDGLVQGSPNNTGSVDVTVMARSAGGTDPEVMKVMTVFR